MTNPGTEIDPAVVEATAERAFGYLLGGVISGMIYLGDRMGIYRSMRGAGALSSGELAARTGLHERWLREWLQGQAGAGLLAYRGGAKFELTPEAALVLADEENPASLIGAFDSYPDQMAVLNKLPQAFQSGLGLTYDQAGPSAATSVERMLGPWHKTVLVPVALPALDGVVPRLQAGAKVADVGCGAGLALLTMAKAFPKSQFHGYDNSLFALERAAANLRAAGAKNVTFHNADSDPLPADASFDFVTTLDCLHDMAHPERAAAAIRRAIKPDGTWFIVDVESAPDFEGNLENPMAGGLYAMSVMVCMSSSMSEPDGLGLGTVGLPEPRLKELVTGAGFRRFARVPGMEHPFNAYYEVRP